MTQARVIGWSSKGSILANTILHILKQVKRKMAHPHSSPFTIALVSHKSPARGAVCLAGTVAPITIAVASWFISQPNRYEY